jgi:hypothetical protein
VEELLCKLFKNHNLKTAVELGIDPEGESMSKFTISIVAMFLLNSCISNSAPKNDAKLSSTIKISDLVGCYINLGESGTDDHFKHYLSSTIWPFLKADPSTIKFIGVEKISENTLNVSGRSNTEVIFQSNFTEGKDFKLKNGVIIIKNKFMGSAASEPGNPFIGVANGSTVLGIDTNGNGKLSNSASFAGTAFIFFPMVGHISSSIRFTKFATLCN